MMHIKRIQTWNDGDSRIHLRGLSDFTLCGLDAVGDDLVHDKDPVILEGRPKVTCEHCLDIIRIVKAHLKEKQYPCKT